MAIPVAAAALAFTSAASAATTQPVVYTPTDSTTLQTDISTADGAAPGTLSIIQLCGCSYQPTESLPLSGNIEITGPPTFQSQLDVNQDPDISGGVVFNLSPAVPLFVINPGANILFKGFDLTNGGNGEGVGSVEVIGGNIELDNMAVSGSLGSAMVLQEGSATLANTSVTGGVADGIEQNGTATVTLLSDTFSYNGLGAIEGPNISSYNTLFDKNAQGGGAGACGQLGTAGDTFVDDYSNDSSCGTSGVTVSTLVSRDTNLSGFYGGPTLTAQLKTGNPAIGHGLPQYCPTADQRFFLYTQGSGGTCDVGSYQTTGVQDTSTTGPTCTIASVNESTDPTVPSMETVNAAEASGIGIGADGVNYTITNNGTVSYPVSGSSWFNATSPSLTIDPAYPSTSAYPVTAAKPVGDLTVNDTKWSFYASDWLGNTTYCN